MKLHNSSACWMLPPPSAWGTDTGIQIWIEQTTTLAFPLLGKHGRADEISGALSLVLNPDMQSNWHEFGVKSIGDTMDIVECMERAAEWRRLSSPCSVSMPHVAMAANNSQRVMSMAMEHQTSICTRAHAHTHTHTHTTHTTHTLSLSLSYKRVYHVN